VFGAEHSKTLLSRDLLATLLLRQGKHAEEEVERRAVLGIRERVLGAEHPETLGSRYRLAVSLRDLGRRKEALVEAEAAYDGMRKVMADGTLTLLTAKWLVEKLRKEPADK
jgi:hypothetical protein